MRSHDSTTRTRSHSSQRWATALLLALAACKPAGATTSPDATGKRETHEPRKGEPQAEPAKPIVFASTGAPHSAPITVVALSPDGKAALTRDTAGGVRMWPALDGSREPLVVPIRDPRSFALGPAEEGGWIAALVDSAGGARVIQIDAAGKMSPLASLPPMAMLSEMLVLPGGQRLLGVGSDHVIHLYDRKGKELAKLDKPKLRPAALRIALEAEGGPRVFALTAGEFDKTGRFAVEVLPLVIGDAKLELGTDRQTVLLDAPTTPDNPLIAPDGRSVVYVQKQREGSGSWKVHATQLHDGLSTSVDSELVGVMPRIALLPKGRVLLDDGGGMGRIADLADKQVEVTALRSSPTVNHLAAVSAGATRAIPSTTWLAVHQLDRDEMLYLGYDPVSVTDVGLAPDNQRVAWALGDRLAVEQLVEGGGGEVLEVPGTRGIGFRNVDFIDADKLVALDWSGGAQVIGWRSGEIVDAIDVGNNVSVASYAYSAPGEGVLFVRTNLWQNPLVIELDAGHFAGRHLVYGAANLMGPLSPTGKSIDEWGTWTLDGTAKLRLFTLAELRGGLDTVSAVNRGEVLGQGYPEQYALDAAGHSWWVRTEGVSRPRLYRGKLGTSQSERDVLLPTGFITMLEPSPEGRRIAIAQSRDASQIVSVYDAETLQLLWARPAASVGGIAWSQDGSELAIAGQFAGGVVYGVEDGQVETSRCGLAFQARKTPPVSGGFFQQLSLCEG